MRIGPGTVAVVTGAGSGIGAALARALDARGARLALCDLDEGALKASTAGLNQPLCVGVDVSDEARMRAFGDQVAAELGAPGLVVANAGVNLSGDFLRSDLDDWKWLMDINFWGVVHTARTFVPPMVQAGAGRFVAISSIFGIVGVPNQAAYCASKAAVRGFTESLEQELRPTGVGVTCVHPGGVATNIVRKGRVRETLNGMTREKVEKIIDRGMPADQAVQVLLAALDRGKRRVLIGPDARLLDAAQRLFPVGYRELLDFAGRRS